KQSAVAAVNFAEAGFLCDDRPARRQVTTAAIAKPTGVKSHVLIFRDRELAFRFADVIAIEPVIDAHLMRRSETPAVALELRMQLSIFYVRRELECFARAFGRLDKANELARFAP